MALRKEFIFFLCLVRLQEILPLCNNVEMRTSACSLAKSKRESSAKFTKKMKVTQITSVIPLYFFCNQTDHSQTQDKTQLMGWKAGASLEGQ